ncbi:MAG: D-alanyl-D-alanine carboxypeptidase [Candidatus Paceibacteria bacterium]|jgi:D-alanyl-D-alanine carboxypeptidase
MKDILKKLSNKNKALISILTLVLVSTPLILQNLNLKSELDKLVVEITALKESIVVKDNDISNLMKENNQIGSVLSEEQKKVVFYEEKITDYSNEVVELKKLTTIDPELIQKYSKVFFLNEHYIPDDLVDIDSDFVYGDDKELQILYQVSPFLDDMLSNAKKDDIDLQVVSSFRSFETQQNLKTRYNVTYGASTANQFSADQGYSEHQLGTTIDFSTLKLKGSLEGFENTDEYEWLKDNAHRFGFVLSYPNNNPYYQFEPWHWRFVGTRLARKLDSNDEFFYDWKQRDINKYLIDLFE